MVLLAGRHGLRSDVNDDAAVFDSVTIARYLRPWQLDGAAAAHFTALLVDPLRNGEVRGGLAPTPNGHRGSVFASPVHEFPDFGNNDGTFTNRGSDTLD